MTEAEVLDHIEAVLAENAVSLRGLERERHRDHAALEDERYAAARAIIAQQEAV